MNQPNKHHPMDGLAHQLRQENGLGELPCDRSLSLKGFKAIHTESGIVHVPNFDDTGREDMRPAKTSSVRERSHS